MKKLQPTSQYKKDLKRYNKGCLECHINGDFLLIWYDKNRDVIELVRLGSHSELFR